MRKWHNYEQGNNIGKSILYLSFLFTSFFYKLNDISRAETDIVVGCI